VFAFELGKNALSIESRQTSSLSENENEDDNKNENVNNIVSIINNTNKT
jgi:hypothetical protein